MALMFQRIARNYINDGYFPTDAPTTQSILAAIKPSTGTMRIIDPCAGEGVALAECQHHLGMDNIESFGVEYHQDRAQQAKQLLTRCLHSDLQDTVISQRSFGLLWLNPPYGDLVSDKARTGEEVHQGRKRLEKRFYQKTVRLLQYGGILVLIVPHYTLDKPFRRWLAAGFNQLHVGLAPEQRFQQAIIMGVKRKADASDAIYQQGLSQLQAFFEASDKPYWPNEWLKALYPVPSISNQEIKFYRTIVEKSQLVEEVERFQCLWPQFTQQFGAFERSQRRPLMQLSDWHLALSLAAGQVSGVVHSNDGSETWVIKGDTHKDKQMTVTHERQSNGRVSEIRTATDIFVPVIKALDFTPNSPTYGRVLTIK